MCLGSDSAPSIPAVAAAPPLPATPELPNQVSAAPNNAGANSIANAYGAAENIATTPVGLSTPPSTTSKSLLGD